MRRQERRGITRGHRYTGSTTRRVNSNTCNRGDKQEIISEEEDNGELTDQEKVLKKEEEEYAIYFGMLSEEEENDTKTDTNDSP